MPDPTLRELAQAVVDAEMARDACPLGTPERDAAIDSVARASAAWARAIGKLNVNSTLAALNAADAQGYARAMGEVVERCEATTAEHVKARRWDPYAMGLCDEMDRVADWARERLPAAGERN